MDTEGLDTHTNIGDEPSPVQTLNRIHAGGQVTLMRVHLLLVKLRGALDNGEFVEALTHIQHIASFLTPLAEAQRVLGFIGQGQMVDARDIEQGMTIIGMGRVRAITDGAQECHDPGCNEIHCTVEMEDGNEFVLLDSMTLVCAVEDEPSGAQPS